MRNPSALVLLAATMLVISPHAAITSTGQACQLGQPELGQLELDQAELGQAELGQAGQLGVETQAAGNQTQAANDTLADDEAEASRDDIAEPAGEEEAMKSKNASRLNLALKTGGGIQLWTDHLYRGGYRIQQNALTGHWRLLDADDVRQTWGSFDHCQSVLDELQPKPSESEPPRHVVVVLHGLMRTHHSMKSLQGKLAEQTGREVIRFAYASTRSSIADHAAALRQVLEGFPPQTQFSFVGHSMGNIVVRYLIGELQRDGDASGLLDRCKSMVMFGPPNQGAAIARRLAPTGVFGIVTGKGGMELGPQWEDFVQHLARPPFPFAIIAGDLSENRIQNPLVPGSGDYIVSVEEARLDGAELFETVPVIHSLLMNDETVTKMTVDFLQSHR